MSDRIEDRPPDELANLANDVNTTGLALRARLGSLVFPGTRREA